MQEGGSKRSGSIQLVLDERHGLQQWIRAPGRYQWNPVFIPYKARPRPIVLGSQRDETRSNGKVSNFCAKKRRKTQDTAVQNRSLEPFNFVVQYSIVGLSNCCPSLRLSGK
jgi:hypothetical protein